MSTITVSKAKKLVGDRDCHIGDPPITVPSSLGNVIGIGGTVENSMPKPKQLKQTPHSISTSYSKPASGRAA